MAIEFTCPNCGKVLRCTDDRAGMSARCPGCEAEMTIPGGEPPEMDVVESAAEPEPQPVTPTPAAPEPEGPAGDVPQVPAPEAPLDPDRVPCPVCGGPIRKGVVVCRHCGERLERNVVVNTAPVPVEAFDAVDCFTIAWNLFKVQWGPLTVGVLVAGLGAMLVGFASLIPAILSWMLLQEASAEAQAITVSVCIGLAIFAMMLTSGFVQLGLTRFALRVARGGRADFSDLISGGRYYVRAVILATLINAATILGVLACYVPGLIIALIFTPAYFLLIDRDTTVIQTLKTSWNLGRRNVPGHLLIFVLGLAISSIGQMACCVGLIPAMAFLLLVNAVSYLQMTGQIARPVSRPPISAAAASVAEPVEPEFLD